MKKVLFALALILSLVTVFAFESGAQVARFKSPYGEVIDTVTNAGTAYVTVRNPAVGPNRDFNTVVEVYVTKISGTVGGIISLQGSLDGEHFKALNTVDTQTALATITATDATNSYHWRLTGNPFLYYRISWTGTGTMSASFGGSILTR